MVAAKSEREEAEVASPVASLNMDAAAGAESPPQAATSSRDTIDGRRESCTAECESERSTFGPAKS